MKKGQLQTAPLNPWLAKTLVLIGDIGCYVSVFRAEEHVDYNQ